MTRKDAFRDAVQDACELIRQSARGPQRTVSLSPEVVELLRRTVQGVAAPAADVAALEDSFSYAPESSLDEVTDLEGLGQRVSLCRKCELAATRTKTVFGSGNPNAGIVFVGEAPGQDEDLQGLPFVGRAGQLLTDIIEKGMKLKRSDVYICNVLKCRPPNNRNPLPHEVEMCEPYLIRQLEFIRPKVICALGTYAAQTLLKTAETIGRLRGRWHFYHGIPLRATYHPAYLLRSPGDKRKTWDDVREVLKVLNGEVTPKEEG